MTRTDVGRHIPGEARQGVSAVELPLSIKAAQSYWRQLTMLLPQLVVAIFFTNSPRQRRAINQQFCVLQ
jgi:hypothetical protein